VAAQQHRNGDGVGGSMRRGVNRVTDIGSDVGDLMADFGVLARKEVELAQAEMGESVGHLKGAAVFGVATAVFALLMLAFAAVTGMVALDLVMPLWLAALITAGALAALTLLAGLVMYGQVKRISIAPKRAMRSVQEDVEWARNQLNWNAR
jgi:Zn-dependent protease